MSGLGPADPLRSVPAADLLAAASSAAAQAGVTRLADVTRLDRIGLPVWQAVRPASRALSVHQGKGASPEDAQLGALLEAVESHAAESFQAVATVCSFDDLPQDRRAPAIGDFAADREQPPKPDEWVGWVEGEALPGARAALLPFPLVSLDFTTASLSRFDRASNGVATGRTRDEAILAALHELIERDAVVEWQAEDMVARMAGAVDPRLVPFDWFRELEERIARAGASVACYCVPALTGTPVFACEINDTGKDGLPYRAMQGRAAHPVPEVALFKAIAEACQSRAAFIAGARDDLLPSLYAAPETAIAVAFALPLPPGMSGVDFAAVADGPRTVEGISAALAAAGYDTAAVIELACPAGLCVVRAFVCGLGSMTRRRRPPIQ